MLDYVANQSIYAALKRGIEVPLRAQRIYMYLSHSSDKKDMCHGISILDIVEDCHLSRSTVKRALADLVALGLVIRKFHYIQTKRKKNWQRENTYTVCALLGIEPHQPKAEPKIAPPADESIPSTDNGGFADEQVSLLPSEPVQPCTPSPVTDEPQGGPPVSQHFYVRDDTLRSYALTDRLTRTREEFPKKQYTGIEITTAAKKPGETLDTILGRCCLQLFSRPYRVMFSQAIVSLFFATELRVNKSRIPNGEVRRCMQNLNFNTLLAAQEKLESCKAQDIKNTSGYVQAVVFNSISEHDSDLIRSRGGFSMTG